MICGFSGLPDVVVHWVTSVASKPAAMTKNSLRTFALGLNFAAGLQFRHLGTARADGNVSASVLNKTRRLQESNI